jgi:hypothetical protein
VSYELYEQMRGCSDKVLSNVVCKLGISSADVKREVTGQAVARLRDNKSSR